MNCHFTEHEVWSGLDRKAPEVLEHVLVCKACGHHADAFRASVVAVTEASTPTTEPLPTRIGTYRIQRRLGLGGMGIVYEGEQQAPKRLVAIKVVRGGAFADPYRLRLFEREAQTLARLRHPAIAAIYEGGRTPEGEPFFAMELVHGIPLTQHVREGRIARRARLELFLKICDAINYAHQRGVIHRDLKPSNILVDAENQVKVLDFGLARIADPETGAATITIDAVRLMGTLPYMSPEEARGNPDAIDVRSDVYSLGVILYELLTDQLPYSVSRSNLPEAVRVICEVAPKRPSLIDRSLAGDLDTIALKALEKEQSRRYQTVAGLADDVQRYLTDRPILARRASTLYRLRKLLARRKIVVLFTLATIGLVFGSHLWIRDAEEKVQSSVQLTVDLQDLRVAAERLSLAKRAAELGQSVTAEQGYREALSTFIRLDREDYTARAELALGQLLLSRSENELAEAESHLRAAVGILQSRAETVTELRHALEALTVIYAPDKLDDPESLEEALALLRGIEEGQLPLAPSAGGPAR